MHDESRGPLEIPADEGIPIEEAGFIPPDPDEPPPVELWRAGGGVTPWGTTLILLSWSAVFAALALNGEIGITRSYIERGASVTDVPALETAWRLLASTYLHGGIGHLFFNAVTMVLYGPAIERLFSRWGFWIVYAFGGAAASLSSLAWHGARGGETHVSIGASGAVFALGGAILTAAFRLRRRLAPGRARALGAAILYLALPSLAAGFERRGTDNAAHAGGLLAGLCLGALVPLNARLGGARAPLLVRAAGAASILALALALARVIRGA